MSFMMETAAASRYKSKEKDGHYDGFKASFEKIYGSPWVEERDAYEHRRDETISALSESTGMSVESAAKLIVDAQEGYSLSVEKFARRVKEYLDAKGKNQRVLFVADEVGQFIGSNTHLMLNLQTIVENLGTACNGRAWVVVTSQEELDAVLGDVVGSKSNDFSKIQGRFSTRISLSSSNIDEVIQARLLEKKPEAEPELNDLFKKKGDVLKNQLTFNNNGATLKNFKDAEDFAKNYPFAPYHYQLVQAVFESIRKAGATGLHLARGERSMLDAFQLGAKSIAEYSVGKLVPFYRFYPSVESFLDTAVSKTINQAGENESLEKFDVEILRLLFLIRYVEIIKPNIDNIVTLCITQVDDDRIALKKQVEESLARLEKQTLVNRNGDLYYFLTNEERDIGREIKNVDISAEQRSVALANILFEDALKDAGRYRYPVNKKDFDFNRLTDSRPYQGSQASELNLEIITPLNFDFDSYTPQKCVLSSHDRVLLKLPENDSVKAELFTFLQTQRYILQKNDSGLPETTRRILREKASENQQRERRITELLKELIEGADVYASGQLLSKEQTVSVAEAQNYLIKNLYGKLGYLDAPASDPIEEIKSVLLANDVAQLNLGLDAGQPNANALSEIRSHIELRANSNMRITLDEVARFFERQPFGWRDLDTVLLIAKLYAAGELTVKIEGAAVEPRASVETFAKPGRWKLVGLFKRRTTGATDLAAARKLAHEIFGKLGNDTNEDSLAKFIRGEVSAWQDNLKDYRTRSETGEYPGFERAKAVLELVNSQAEIADTYEFFRVFNEKGTDWHEAREDYVKLTDFYKNQIEIWRRARSKMNGSFKDNRSLLNLDVKSRDALHRLEEIFSAPEPYGLIREMDKLIAAADAVNQQVFTARRSSAIGSIDARINQLKSELDAIRADSDTRNAILFPFQTTKGIIENEESIQRIAYQEGEHAEDLFQNALEAIENKRSKEDSTADDVVRSTRIVKPAQFSAKPFLETADDVDEFLKALRSEMEGLLKENVRIRIQ